MTASESGTVTVRAIVKAYVNQQIDMDEMIHAIVQRLQETANDPPEEYDRDEHIAHPDNPITALRVRMHDGEISEEEYEHVMSVLGPILFDE